MSRGLSSTEKRICQVICAFLGALFFAFLVLNTIESLLNSSPPIKKLPPDTTNISIHAKQTIPSSRALQAARYQTEPAQGAPDDPAPAPLPSIKARSGPVENQAVERSIRFDPQRLERSIDGNSVVLARGLLRLSSADALTKIPSVESFEVPQGGPIVTPMFETAEPPSAPPPEPKPVASSAKSASKDSAPDVVSLNSEDTQQIQARLRDLGFLPGPPTGAWDARSRAALRDFKVVNHLANNDILDPQTQEKLTSQIAVRPDQSFIGSWSKAPCDSTSKENLRLTINSRRIKTSDGAVCEFHDFASDPPGWRLRATCSQGKERWKADGKFTLRNKKLIWASEGDVSSYFRCK
jgi:Putative peptidoglycan binding domain